MSNISYHALEVPWAVRRARILEPDFSSVDKLKAIPGVADAFSRVESKPIVVVLAFKMRNMRGDKVINESIEQKEALLFDRDTTRELGRASWIRGQGEPVFYPAEQAQESVDDILAPIAERFSRAMAGTRHVETPEYTADLSDARKGGEFRVKDVKAVNLEKVRMAFGDVAPNLSLMEFLDPFDQLKDGLDKMPEASGFLATFKEMKLHPELAGKVDDGLLTDATIFIVAEGSDKPLAALRWVAGQGRMFFQNFLDGSSQQPDAILSSIEAKAVSSPYPSQDGSAPVPEAGAEKAAYETPYTVDISENRNAIGFRIMHDKKAAWTKVFDRIRGVAPDLSMWETKVFFDGLTMQPEVRDFMAGFKEMRLHFEFAGNVEIRPVGRAEQNLRRSIMTEATAFLVAESGQKVAAMRWVEGQGRKFFFAHLFGAGEPAGKYRDKSPYKNSHYILHHLL